MVIFESSACKGIEGCRYKQRAAKIQGPTALRVTFQVYVSLSQPTLLINLLLLLTTSTETLHLSSTKSNPMKMLLPNLLTATAFALTAQAFLIPAEVADKAIAAKAVIDEKVHELKDDVVAWATSSKQTVKVDCPGCPYAISSMRGGRHEWTNGINNDLIMEFSTEGTGLSINGAPVLDANLKHVIAPLKVKQVKKESEAKEDGDKKEWKAFEGDLGMSYGLSINKVAQAKDGELLMIELQVLGLDGQMVNPDTVDLGLIRKPDGEVSIIYISRLFIAILTSVFARCSFALSRLIPRPSPANNVQP